MLELFEQMSSARRCRATRHCSAGCSRECLFSSKRIAGSRPPRRPRHGTRAAPSRPARPDCRNPRRIHGHGRRQPVPAECHGMPRQWRLLHLSLGRCRGAAPAGGAGGAAMGRRIFCGIYQGLEFTLDFPGFSKAHGFSPGFFITQIPHTAAVACDRDVYSIHLESNGI